MAKKESTKAKKNTVAEPIVEKVAVENPTVKQVKEALENVPTEIVVEPSNETPSEEVQTIEDFQSKMEDLAESKNQLEEKLAAEPEKAQEILQAELQKAKSLKNEALKVIKKARINNSEVTSSWNGINYDF